MNWFHGENGKYETLPGALSTMALCHGYYGRQHTASEKFPQEDPRGQWAPQSPQNMGSGALPTLAMEVPSL